jgi:hypothetical protein
VAEDLHDHADVDALLKEDCRRRVTPVMHTNTAYARVSEKRFPVFPIVPRVDRATVNLAEHEIVVLPCLASREPCAEL